ncbi:MAG: hypothetical protein ABI811_02730 [Acidobacteriota bacterium]
MSLPLSPGYFPELVPELARRKFSFSPAIAGVEHNEWTLLRATWNEIVVKNTITSHDVAIPRRFFGDLAKLEAPVRVVALNRRLEQKGGRAVPLDRAVLPFPVVNEHSAARATSSRTASVIPIREGSRPRSRVRHWLRISIAVASLLCFVVVFLVRDARLGRATRRSATHPARPGPHLPALTSPALPGKTR